MANKSYSIKQSCSFQIEVHIQTHKLATDTVAVTSNKTTISHIDVSTRLSSELCNLTWNVRTTCSVLCLGIVQCL